ncbi:MAG: hypothetical protein RLZ98_3746 [Pseudomonadota bacterium]|jgi:hypothetical protein
MLRTLIAWALASYVLLLWPPESASAETRARISPLAVMKEVVRESGVRGVDLLLGLNAWVHGSISARGLPRKETVAI